MSKVLEKSMVQLVRNNRFYSKILLRIKKIEDNTLPTMGVSIKNGLTLRYNPLFFKDRSVEEQIDLLKHEISHLGYHHFDRAKNLNISTNKCQDSLTRMVNPSTWNKAADIAINQLLPNLPKSFKLYDKNNKVIVDDEGKPKLFNGIFVEDLDTIVPEPVKRNMPMEYYYRLMKEHGEPEDSDSTLMDDHQGFEDAECDEEVAKELIKKVFNEAADECGGRYSGNIPGDMKQILEDLNHKPKDWRDEVAIFVAKNSSVEIETTRRRKNRRYGWKYPGVRYEPKLVLAVAIDTSGSVRDEELRQFMAEIDSLYHLGIKVVLIHCDTQVNHVELYEPESKIEIHGRGGTCFAPVFELLNSNDFSDEYGEVDGLIYLTDGENWNEDIEEPDYSVLWALLPNHSISYDWGDTTTIEIKTS